MEKAGSTVIGQPLQIIISKWRGRIRGQPTFQPSKNSCISVNLGDT